MIKQYQDGVEMCRMTVIMPASYLAGLKAFAMREDLTVSDVVRRLIRQHLDGISRDCEG